MRQFRNEAAIPEVDLRMAEGVGFIRGLSGTVDAGITFEKAGTYLKQRAEREVEFSWTIVLDLDFGPTPGLRRLMEMVGALDEIARDSSLQADVNLVWKIPRHDVSLMHLAKDTERHLLGRGRGGLKFTLADWDIFLSYSHSDTAFAVWIEKTFKAADLKVFSPFSEMAAGIRSPDLMRRAVAGSNHFVALVSPAYLASEHCQAERLTATTVCTCMQSPKMAAFAIRPTEIPAIPEFPPCVPLLGLAAKRAAAELLRAVGHAGHLKKVPSGWPGMDDESDQTTDNCAERKEWYISYAWGDVSSAAERKEESVVDQVCAGAKAQGVKILRDKNELSLGDSISAFMRRIGKGDRIFVILSNAYLQSPHCMLELCEIWRTSEQEQAAFLDRVRVYALPGAKIWKSSDWVDWAIYWKKEHDELDSRARAHGAAILGEGGHRRLIQMQRFYTQVSDILDAISDKVQARTLEQFEQWGFEE